MVEGGQEKKESFDGAKKEATRREIGRDAEREKKKKKKKKRKVASGPISSGCWCPVNSQN